MIDKTNTLHDNPATGNLLSRSDMGTYTYTQSKPHAVISAGTNTYVYDANGNMTHRNAGNTQWEYTYDAENHLVEVEKDDVVVNRYLYDGDGNRVARLGADNKGTIFIGNYFEAVFPHYAIPGPLPPVTEGDGGENEPEASTPISQGDITYYYAGSQRIAMRDAWGVYFLFSDHLGSSSVVIDASGQVVEEGYYMPWGGERGNQEIELTDYGFTGQMKEGDIYFYNSRWYDPELGRFMQADTIVPMASQGTQAFDRYAYVNNCPMVYRDEDGHWITTLVGGIIGAAIGYGAQVYQNAQSGMQFTDALTTDISAEKILAGAVAGALVGTLLPAAATAISTTGLFTSGMTIASAACEDGDCANEATTVYNALKMQSVRVTGSLGELASGITRTYERIYSVTRTAMYRVPDRLDHDLRVLTEVKNVATLQLTNQIRDFALYKSPEGYSYSLEIITRVTTNITQTMQRFIEKYGIKIIRLIE